jgi:hypothetical protein
MTRSDSLTHSVDPGVTRWRSITGEVTAHRSRSSVSGYSRESPTSPSRC